MKNEVRLSLVQFASVPLDPARNAERMAEFVRRESTDHGADLVVFPELASTGYVQSARDDAFAERLYAASEPIPGPTVARLSEAARDGHTHVIAGISQHHPRIRELLYNSAVLIGPDGALIGVQHKVHACRDEKEYYVPGDAIVTFDTELGRIGLELCYDVRFPEMARVQALDGAEIILSLWAAAVQPGRVPNDSIIARCATRAMENALFFAGCNRTGPGAPDEVFFGHSAIAAPDGSTLAASHTMDEEVIRATLHAEALPAQRRYLTIFRDRRPELYQPVSEPLSRQALGTEPATTS